MAYTGLEGILKKGMEMGASDIHLGEGQIPLYRVNGRLISLAHDTVLGGEEIRGLLQEAIPHQGIMEVFREQGEVDFAGLLPGITRFRANLFKQRNSWALAVRIIPLNVPAWDELNLPPILKKLAIRKRGLLLFSGSSGSGKSTTLAAIIEFLNQSHRLHIVTLEDPIEYLHINRHCIINQREIGKDSKSFPQALRAALRQDPDVIMVGEMRDLATISTTITAAETGHMVLASLHSGTAVQSIERIVDVFPPHQQVQLRLQLANCLQGVINQQLFSRADTEGRIPAVEVLIATNAVRNLIRENKIYQIYSAMQTGYSSGMKTMEKALQELQQQGLIGPK